MRSGKNKTDRKSPGKGNFRREPDLGSSPFPPMATQSVQASREASEQTGFSSRQDKPLGKDASAPPMSAPVNAASSSFSHPENSRFADRPYYPHVGAAPTYGQNAQANAGFIPGTLPYSESVGPTAGGGFPPNGGYYGSPSPGTAGGKSNSSLHAALIVTMVFIGLAIGLANFIWANDKREAKIAQEVLAKSLAMPPVTDTSSRSSGALPPAGTSDSGSDSYQADPLSQNRSPAGQALEQELTSEKNEVKLDGYLTPSLALPQALERMKQEEKQLMSEIPPSSAVPKSDKTKPEASDESVPPSKAVAQPEKKRKPRAESQSRKLADAARKERERLKEIDRVRTQAYSESSKDRVGNRKSGSDTSIGPQSERRRPYRSSELAQRTVTSSEYARCERAGSIIDRERCKWQLCNNKWGKGGCPSFKPERSYVF